MVSSFCGGRSRFRGARRVAMTVRAGRVLRRARGTGESAYRAAARAGGDTQTVERLASRLTASRREDYADHRAEHAAEHRIAHLPHARTIAARGYLVNTRLPSATSTLMVSPSLNSPRSIALDSGFSTRRWMARFMGRAPYSAS